jgi:ribosomal protein L29
MSHEPEANESASAGNTVEALDLKALEAELAELLAVQQQFRAQLQAASQNVVRIEGGILLARKLIARLKGESGE